MSAKVTKHTCSLCLGSKLVNKMSEIERARENKQQERTLKHMRSLCIAHGLSVLIIICLVTSLFFFYNTRNRRGNVCEHDLLHIRKIEKQEHIDRCENVEQTSASVYIPNGK